MDFFVCRTCLSIDNLSPIFSNVIENLTEIIFSIAGIRIEPNDGLSQNICTNCIKIIKNTQNFKEKCISSYIQLSTIKKEIICNLDIKKEPITKLNKNIKGENDSSDEEPLIKLKQKLNHRIDINTKIKLTNIVKYADDNKAKITCKLCQKSLSVRSFGIHMVRCHPGADNSRVKCEFCDDYILKESLNRHLKLMHGSDKFRCRYCKREYKTKDRLLEHVTICNHKKKKKTTKSSRELIECDVCQKKMLKASLRMHKAITHAGQGPVCEHCGRRFGNKFRLNEHYRAKHGYEKLKCSICDFQSSGVMAIRNHERRHRGEKPYVCETCGAKFHAAYLLAQHKQSHRTSKLFKCDICPASFKTGNSLRAHRATCHSARRVSCAVCARAYSCRPYAARHMRAVHGVTAPAPAHCTAY